MTEPRVPGPPDLEALRLQLGDAIFEARLAVARRREQIVASVRAATAQGVPFADAVAARAPDVSAATVRRWDDRWSRHGVAGLVELRRGSAPEAVKARPAAGEADGQLPLAGVLASQRPLPRLRSRERRGGPPSALLKWPGSKAPIVGTLLALSPARFERYHEPFVGSGALFFALRPAAAFLSDQNRELTRQLYAGFEVEALSVIRQVGRARRTPRASPGDRGAELRRAPERAAGGVTVPMATRLAPPSRRPSARGALPPPQVARDDREGGALLCVKASALSSCAAILRNQPV